MKKLIGAGLVMFGLIFIGGLSLVQEAKAYVSYPTPQQAIARYYAFLADALGGSDAAVSIDGTRVDSGQPPGYPGLISILNLTIKDVNEHTLMAIRNYWDWQWTTIIDYANQQLKEELWEYGHPEWFDEIMDVAVESYKDQITTPGEDGRSIVDLVAEFFGVDPSQINVDRVAQVGTTADIDGINALMSEDPISYTVLSFASDPLSVHPSSGLYEFQIMKQRWAFDKEYSNKAIKNMINAAIEIKSYFTDFLRVANHDSNYELNFSKVAEAEDVLYNPFIGELEEVTIKSIPDLDLLNSFLQGDQFYSLFVRESEAWWAGWTERDFGENPEAYQTALFNLEIFIKTCEIAYPEAVEKRNGGEDIDVYNKVELADKLTKDVDKIVRGIWADLDFNPDEYGWEVTEELVNDWIIPAVERYYSQLAQVPDVIGTTAYYSPAGQDGGSVGTVSEFGGFQGNNSPFGGDVNSNLFGGELW